MTIPALTPAQVFQSQCIYVINYMELALSANGNLNLPVPEGAKPRQITLVTIYTNCYNLLFNNTNNVGGNSVVATNLSTNGASVLNPLAGLYTILNTAGIPNLTAIPAYTANDDGTVTFS